MKSFFLMALICTAMISHSQNSIYGFSVDSIANQKKIDFSNFRNRKILIVNTATLDKNLSQIVELEKLQKQFPDSLVIVIFPTNDFNSEPADNPQIVSFLQHYHLSIMVGSKTSAKGDHISSLYQWITNQTINGATAPAVSEVFQKYLFDESGSMLAVFSSDIRPLSTTIINAIR